MNYFNATVPLQICEVYPSFGNAYAQDHSGQRFLVNAGSGVKIDRLVVGLEITAHVTERNYVERICSTDTARVAAHRK